MEEEREERVAPGEDLRPLRVLVTGWKVVLKVWSLLWWVLVVCEMGDER